MRAVVASLVFLTFAASSFAQAPFTPTAQLGVPTRIGAIATVSGSKETLDTGVLRELTLQRAELALWFPNRSENIVAAANEKLLILRASLRNPGQKANVLLSPGDAIGFGTYRKYTGTGKIAFVSHMRSDTLEPLRVTLNGGESASFVSVWRIPADLNDFQLGIVSGQRAIVPKYDLTNTITHITSVFATADGLGATPSALVPAGKAFEMDGLEMTPGTVSTPARIAGSAVDRSKTLYVVNLGVRNKMLLPVRWGWQYVTAELVAVDGTTTKAYPDLINQATDASWIGELAPDASVASQFLFYPERPVMPKALRLTMASSGRTVEIALAR